MAVGAVLPESLLPVSGIKLATVAAGIRSAGRPDLVLIDAGPEASIAAVFTRNVFCAAPVQVARDHLRKGQPRYLLINAGNANAGTGLEGLNHAHQTCSALAKFTGASATAVLPFSTGVIGEPLPVGRIVDRLPYLLQNLREDGWLDSACAIMTTDTVAKGFSREVMLSGGCIRFTGIAKGSGMIHPDMATMLAFIGTDAQIDPALLQRLLSKAVEVSFNRITVDGDTSTNDALVCIATGVSHISIMNDEDLCLFTEALHALCKSLAEAIVRDGEGATKFVIVEVQNARNEQEAKKVSEAVALSPLVKTALFASDPNWGRILAAIGRSGVDGLRMDRVDVYVNGVQIVAQGGRSPDYSEALGQEAFAEEEVRIRIELGLGSSNYEKLTCDLSHDYVRINAEYRS